jgi:uncharacterized protein GlcG (DUF336 family)
MGTYSLEHGTLFELQRMDGSGVHAIERSSTRQMGSLEISDDSARLYGLVQEYSEDFHLIDVD